MFFSHWVKELGIDKTLAPISNDSKVEDDTNDESIFTTIFETVAPRSPPPPQHNSDNTLKQKRQDMNSSSVLPICASGPNLPSLTFTTLPDLGSFPKIFSPDCLSAVLLTSVTLEWKSL